MIDYFMYFFQFDDLILLEITLVVMIFFSTPMFPPMLKVLLFKYILITLND